MQHPILVTAIRAARKAGDISNRSFNRVNEVNITCKAHNDFVTDVDQRAYPDHGILAEEGTG